MQETYRPFYSHALGHDVEMLVFGERGYPVIVFPTSGGRYYQAKDFGLVDAAAPLIDSGKIRLYCVDSVDGYSWYGQHLPPQERLHNHIRYDRMLTEELVPQLQRENNVAKVAVAGCSFGGYHALNFAFRHPSQVSHMFSMGAKFDISNFLGGYHNDDLYFNNPPAYMPAAQDDNFYQMGIVLGSAVDDFCKQGNIEMSEILNRKGISHWLDIRPYGTHDWPVWRDMFPEYLAQIEA
ncbi:esterase family protein [Hymenobacter profundi]|uniref:Esterase n=1 Tax=Hymenobacter profundi TaxID=1982110 RepID=A0ABS6X5J5_9BACT|nr:esterase [Hymenobacter profundi]